MPAGDDLHAYIQHVTQIAARTAAAHEHEAGMRSSALVFEAPAVADLVGALTLSVGAALHQVTSHLGHGASPEPAPSPGQIATEEHQGGVHGPQREGFDAHSPAVGQGREAYGPPMAPAGHALTTTPGDILREDERLDAHGPERGRDGQVLGEDEPPEDKWAERRDGRTWVQATGKEAKGAAATPGEILRGEEHEAAQGGLGQAEAPKPGGFAEQVLRAREGNPQTGEAWQDEKRTLSDEQAAQRQEQDRGGRSR